MIDIDELSALERKRTQAKLWTYDGTGVFSKGEEGLALHAQCPSCEESFDCDNVRADTEFLVTIANNAFALIAIVKAAKELQKNIDAGFTVDFAYRNSGLAHVLAVVDKKDKKSE